GAAGALRAGPGPPSQAIGGVLAAVGHGHDRDRDPGLLHPAAHVDHARAGLPRRVFDHVRVRAGVLARDAALPIAQAVPAHVREPRAHQRAGAAPGRGRVAAPRHRRRGAMNRPLQLLLGVTVSALCVWLSMKDVHVAEVLAALRGANGLGFGLVMAMTLLGFWLRAVRWQWFIETNRPLPVSSLFSA